MFGWLGNSRAAAIALFAAIAWAGSARAALAQGEFRSVPGGLVTLYRDYETAPAFQRAANR